MEAGPFKIDDEHQSVIQLAQKSESGGILDSVMRLFTGD
jgi:hypothetical protein